MSINKRFEDCSQELKDFLFYTQTIRGLSQQTVDAYYTDLRTFLRYIRKINNSMFYDTPIDDIEIETLSVKEIQEITLSDVYSYLNYTMDERENNSNTRARKVSSIRAFFKYLTANARIIDENPVKDLETPAIKRALPKYLTLEESIELLNNVNTSNPQRDYCMLVLMLNCGMRVGELVGINIEDIRGDTLKLLGKGNKERIVYLNDACLHAIDEYKKVRFVPPNAKEKNALFMSQRGTRLSARRVQQITNECLSNAGLDGKGISPHKLRHTAATLMYQHGDVDIRVLKEILGHENLATTEIYTHVANSQIEEAAGRSPLAKVKIEPQKSKEQLKKEKLLDYEED